MKVLSLASASFASMTLMSWCFQSIFAYPPFRLLASILTLLFVSGTALPCVNDEWIASIVKMKEENVVLFAGTMLGSGVIGAILGTIFAIT